MAKKSKWWKGDVSQPGLGLDDATRQRLARSLDLVVNSAGLRISIPTCATRLPSNVESAANLVDFLRESDHAALMHLSTCYVVGRRDGRVNEELRPNYTPAGVEGFRRRARMAIAARTGAQSGSARQQPGDRSGAAPPGTWQKRNEDEPPAGSDLENLIRKNRMRWMRNRLTRAGTRRAQHLGWPNTYTFTKSLGESLLATRGAGLPIAVVRPSIVETSTA